MLVGGLLMAGSKAVRSHMPSTLKTVFQWASLMFVLAWPWSEPGAQNQSGELELNQTLELKTDVVNSNPPKNTNVIYVGADESGRQNIAGKVLLVVGACFILVAVYVYGSRSKN